jgi:hypothetical protein
VYFSIPDFQQENIKGWMVFPSCIEMHLPLTILSQPTESTCGPTCLHAVYRYYQDSIPLEEVISGVETLEDGGTLAVFLGSHALQRGYQATIISYDLHFFDPTWFNTDPVVDLSYKLKLQAKHKSDSKLQIVTNAYLHFIELGGIVKFRDFNSELISDCFASGKPVIAGLSATFLYQSARETGGEKSDYDDVRGYSSGHFVVLHGYDNDEKKVHVADPLGPNPISVNRNYRIGIDRIVCATLLGVLTYDANLLIIEKTVSD